MTASRFLSTTANNFDGHRVMRTYGVVRGITVRSRGAVSMFGAKLQTLMGGNISILTDLCERTRADAYDIAVAHAEALGANALLALRYDATEVMPGVTEVLCYGTAVSIAPLRAEESL